MNMKYGCVCSECGVRGETMQEYSGFTCAVCEKPAMHIVGDRLKNKGELQLIDLNICNLDCKCGGNIHIGFSQEDYPKVMKLLMDNFEINCLFSDHKLLYETQESEFPLSCCLNCNRVLENYEDEDHSCFECKDCEKLRKDTELK